MFQFRDRSQPFHPTLSILWTPPIWCTLPWNVRKGTLPSLQSTTVIGRMLVISTRWVKFYGNNLLEYAFNSAAFLKIVRKSEIELRKTISHHWIPWNSWAGKVWPQPCEKLGIFFLLNELLLCSFLNLKMDYYRRVLYKFKINQKW